MKQSEKTTDTRPLPMRILLGVYRASASMQAAVVLIAITTIVLAWATVVENKYNAAAANFGFYGTWWFGLLGALLTLNILLATIIRFPFKRHQTGFVVTHIGLLVLLFGCMVTRFGGEEATLPVIENCSSSTAYKQSQHFHLSVVPGKYDKDDAVVDAAEKKDQQRKEEDTETKIKAIDIPFAPGPFNWADYAKKPWFPWSLSHRDRGVLYDADGVKLEVLDYYSDCELVFAPQIKLNVGRRSSGTQDGIVRLGIREAAGPHMRPSKFGLGTRQTLMTGQTIVFTMTGDEAETTAFLDSAPEGPLGKMGQAVLHVKGKRYQLDIEELTQGKRPLGDSGLTVELGQFDPVNLFVVLHIEDKDDRQGSLALFADRPEDNHYAYDLPAFGSFWFDATQKPAEDGARGFNEDTLRRAAMPRIDILQGADRKLYMRAWHSPRMNFVGPLPSGGTEVIAFEDTKAAIDFDVAEFISADRPGLAPKALSFDKEKLESRKLRAARVRLGLDDKENEFWLLGAPGDPLKRPLVDPQLKVLRGTDRAVVVSMPADEVELGFDVHLLRFTCKLDPGTSNASHYSSLVDLFETRPETDGDGKADDAKAEPFGKDVLISMNAPVDASAPGGGRSYRLFQSSYRTVTPGMQDFETLVDGDPDKNHAYISWLTANYDPGRGLKYVGSLLIVLGVFIMYYMRAYFFRRKPKQAKVEQG